MSALIFEKLAQTLAAGQEWRLNIAGDFFRISGAAWPVSVSLVKNMRIVGTMQNMLAGDYVRDIDFDGVIVANSGVGQDVSVQIAGGGAGSDRVMGEVSVINGEIQRVKANNSFIGKVGEAAAAGNYGHVQLWNPAGSLKNLVVNRLSGFINNGGVAIGFSVAKHQAAMATLVGNGYSKMLDGGQGVGEFRRQQLASVVGTVIGEAIVPTTMQLAEFVFSEPVLVPPGYGLMCVSMAPNYSISATFQWNEEDR